MGSPSRTTLSMGPPFSTRYRRRAINRFLLTYLYRELRGRFRQGLFIALGLGCGVGLVICVSAISDGISNAQRTVLHSLYGIGTDLTVTQRSSGNTNGPAGGEGGGGTLDTLQSDGEGLVPATWVTRISRLAKVESVGGGLTLTELTQLGGGFPVSVEIDGVDVDNPALGPLASAGIVAGHFFAKSESASNVAIVGSDYAKSNKVTLHSTISIAGTRFRVIGIAGQSDAAGPDIYIPLARAQALAHSPDGRSLVGQVSALYVAVASSSDVQAVQTDISRHFPTASVTSSNDLANTISGSLVSVARLSSDLGAWVAAAALSAAFAVAGLLTSADVSRRTRELGTLKALGWSMKRMVAQILSESLLVGTLGALVGVTLGFASAAIVTALAPRLTAVVPRATGSNGIAVAVHLTPAVSGTTIVISVFLALSGALLAGSVGAWRAGKLQPVDAFSQLQ